MFYNTNMGYRVKWVEENLGVSRKALRIFEEKGLMPKNNGKYRDYSNEDVDRIWTIRVLQGMGFTLSEIEKLANDENFDFEASLEKKVKELQEKKEKVDRHLGYAKTIKSVSYTHLLFWKKQRKTMGFRRRLSSRFHFRECFRMVSVV